MAIRRIFIVDNKEEYEVLRKKIKTYTNPLDIKESILRIQILEQVLQDIPISNTEIIIQDNEKNLEVFIDEIKFENFFDSCPPHKHKMTEVQIITNGSADFDIDGNRITVNSLEMLIIPKDTYHQRCVCTENTKVIAFQTTAYAKKCKIFPLKKWLIFELKEEVDILRINKKSAKLPYYFGIILSEFTDLSKNSITTISDRKFLIHEFLTTNYDKDISLADLAKILNLSEKQTERTIQQTTGKNFRKLLAEYRIDAAKILIKSGELSLSQIAEKVGYKSYSGFWKAYKQSE